MPNISAVREVDVEADQVANTLANTRKQFGFVGRGSDCWPARREEQMRRDFSFDRLPLDGGPLRTGDISSQTGGQQNSGAISASQR